MIDWLVLFNSFEFLVFFPTVVGLHYLLPHRFRWGLLLVASCVFYAAFIPKYLLILAGLILVDWTCALMIERGRGRARRVWLTASILATVAILFWFKYVNFFADSATALAKVIGWRYAIEPLQIILPIGLSFHTFQSLAYVIEVYRGTQRAERHLGLYALYVMFFPQLVAGPIERPAHLLTQMRDRHRFRYDDVTAGLKLMAWGLFQKMVLADTIAPSVDALFALPGPRGPLQLFGAFLFAFQIYCDFAGYSDVARGAARVLGFRLMLNFDRPYAAETVAEFWRRWHISLSSWLRDYVYISLGGNRVPTARMCMNLLFTFLLCGLWHGAALTYVWWGGLNGVYLVAGALTRDARARWAAAIGLAARPALHRALRITTTFALVCVGWVFFRADKPWTAWKILRDSARAAGRALVAPADAPWAAAGAVLRDHAAPLACALAVVAYHAFRPRGGGLAWLAARPAPLRWAVYYGVVLAVILLGNDGEQPFIYFQF